MDDTIKIVILFSCIKYKRQNMKLQKEKKNKIYFHLTRNTITKENNIDCSTMGIKWFQINLTIDQFFKIEKNILTNKSQGNVSIWH